MSLPAEAAGSLEGRVAKLEPGGLRGRVAGGTMVNGVYFVALNLLGMVQGLIVARLLGTHSYGLWGLITITYGTLSALSAVGVNDKYIQQNHPDQQAAFEIAFTLQALLCGIFTVLSLIAVPLFCLLYGQTQILPAALVLAVVWPLSALLTPIWVFYRRMDFVRQRLLESINPVISFVVVVGLAALRYGYWALVVGTLVGYTAAALAAVRSAPYPLRLRFEGRSLREYATFSWPLFTGALTLVIAFQVPVTIASRMYGAAAVGAITVAAQITQYTTRVDDVVTHALYPAICAVQDQGDLLFESFSKSNRLALIWGVPVGLGAAVFARPAVHLALGGGWDVAVPLVVVLGISAAVDQIGFNWTAFARARAETRPLAVGAAAFLLGMLGVGVPLLISDGIRGFAFGIAAGTAATLLVRIGYLVRIFPALRIGSHVLRAALPGLLAAAGVLAIRGIEEASGSTMRTVGEVMAFVGIVVFVTLLSERALLVESLGYLRRAARAAG